MVYLLYKPSQVHGKQTHPR